MLTKKQQELLLLIHERLRETGVPPSFDEMKDALGLKSKSGIHRLITALEERGFIRRLPNKARALEVLKLPEAMETRVGKPRFEPNVIEGSLGRKTEHDDSENASVSIPVMGRIAAGVPIDAIQHQSHTIQMPADMLSFGEHYALEVKGDSMIDAGIFDGDTVLIKKGNTASNGEIVVALVDDEEATLKRLRRKGNTIALEAANPNYETRIFGPDRVAVQGTLVALFRRY